MQFLTFCHQVCFIYSQMLGCKETKLTLHVFYETKIETIMFGLSFFGVLKLM